MIEQEMGIWPTSCRDERGNYVPCVAISGHERRASWESYAPVHGLPTQTGAIGCPGGGDWCYASSYGAAQPIPGSAEVRKRAATVAAALAGLGSGVGGALSVARSIGGAPAASGAGSDGSAVPSAGGSVMGEDVRDARASYAPYTHDGRVGALGEIGGGGGSSAAPAAAAAAWSPTSSGRSAGPPKSYAIGSWKK